MATSLPTYTGDTTRLVPPSGNPLTDALLVGSKWGTAPAGTGSSLTVSFPTTAERFDVLPGVAGNYHPQEATEGGYADYLPAFAPFGEAERAAAREVLAAWAAVADLQFNEVAATTTDAGVLRFALSGPPGLDESTYGASAFPQDLPAAGDTWINAGFLYPEGWAAGTQNFLTLLHETGHAIGLKHPHDTGLDGSPGWPSTPAVLPKTGDDTLDAYSTQDMVMAYNDLPGAGSPLQVDFAPTTPMRVDIDAIQFLYGPNRAHNAGDTVYGYQSDQRYNQTIWDGGGNDTIRVMGSADAVVSLVPGSWSELGLPLTYSERNPDLSVAQPLPDRTDPRTVYIHDAVQIENASGGDGNDRLIGNAAANRLQGGAGDDDLDGAAGIDTAVYTGARGAYTVGRTDDGWAVDGEGADWLVAVERLSFADRSLALDTGTQEHGGQTAQILRALFGPSFLGNAGFAGIGIGLLDQGVAYADLVAMAIGTGVFEQLAGSRSNADFVRLVYRNVFGAEVGPGDLAAFAGLLDAGVLTQAGLGVLACQIDVNAASAELVGLAGTGLEFVPAGG